MFNLGFSELLLIGIIALVFVGPKNLPELARTAGRFFRDLKRATNEITDSFQKEVVDLRKEKENIEKEISEDLDIKLLSEDSSVAKNEQPKKQS